MLFEAEVVGAVFVIMSTLPLASLDAPLISGSASLAARMASATAATARGVANASSGDEILVHRGVEIVVLSLSSSSMLFAAGAERS